MGDYHVESQLRGFRLIMSYTVKQLATFSGVSVRTLHYYDEVGLLKPAYIGDNGYRHYEEEQLLLLQQILFFRELGFPLVEIQKILDSDDFDKLKSLESHKQILKQELEGKKILLKTIDKTIQHLRGRVTMKANELYYGFNSEKQRGYEQYLIEHGVCSRQEIEEGRQKVNKWSKENWGEIKQECEELNWEFVAALEKDLDPSSVEVQSLVRRHYQWILHFWTPKKETYIGLAESYLEHPDFRAFYEGYHSDLLAFLVSAMKTFANESLD